jgi:hypothetical protein
MPRDRDGAVTTLADLLHDAPPSRNPGRLLPHPLSESEFERDAIASYYAGIAIIGERVRAGEPIPAFLLPKLAGSAP